MTVIEGDRVLLIVGIAIVVLALSSRVVKRYALSPVLLALAAGVVVGPQALGLVDPTARFLAASCSSSWPA